MRVKLLVFVMILNGIIGTASAALAETDIALGEYLQIGSYAGEPILWRCVDTDENGPLILADKILCLKAFDASGDDLSGSHDRASYIAFDGSTVSSYRTSNGSNYWADSNIRCWLNSASEAGGVEWTCQNPPTAENVTLNLNAYNNEAGFLSGFTASELGVLKTVTQKSLLTQFEYDPEGRTTAHTFNSYTPLIVKNYETAYSEQVTDRMFLLDVKQLYNVYVNFGDYYIAELSQQCINSSESVSALFKVGQEWDYWLRTPYAYAASGYNVRTVNHNGSDQWKYEGTTKVYIYGGHVEYKEANTSHVGVRPAFYLDTDNAVFISGSGSEDDPYIVSGIESSPLVTDWALPVISEYDEKYGISELEIDDYRQAVSRGDFCALAYHTLTGEGWDVEAPETNPFTDTDNEKITALYNAGIINGRSETEFMPDDYITREEAAVILCRLSEYIGSEIPESDNSEYYSDENSISSWALASVKAMKDMGIMTGVSADEFMPSASFTAQQAVTTMLRVF